MSDGEFWARNPDMTLVLADGTEFAGYSFGAPRSCNGEVVFNTGMVGYPESLSDPSYSGQILVLTYPLIGNYGIDLLENGAWGLPRNRESDRIHIRGLVVSEHCEEPHHYSKVHSLDAWLKEFGIPGLFGVDTRALTKLLRENGATQGKLRYGDDDSLPFEDPNKSNLVADVSIKQVTRYGDGPLRIVVVDCGVKNSILSCFLQNPVEIIRVPWDFDFNSIEHDGVFISNGPGDPALCQATVAHLQTAFTRKKPIFGICLGNQLLGLAAGGRTYKLKYGHRSHNQPCQNVETGRCYITSQNHGFALDAASLPEEWRETYRNTNDGTNEGIRHRELPYAGVQFHPEACGGPTDTRFLVHDFCKLVERCKSSA